jgi:hypothetical protein
MAASKTECSWYVLELARCSSFVAVQHAFRRQIWTPWSLTKMQTFLFQMVVICILFSICENMDLQNPSIIYTQPVHIYMAYIWRDYSHCNVKPYCCSTADNRSVNDASRSIKQTSPPSLTYEENA